MRFPFIHLVHEFAWRNKPDECERALVETFGPPHQLPEVYRDELEGLFTEWLMFEFVTKGKITFLNEYVLRNPDQLPERQFSQLKQIAQTQRYSFFEIGNKRVRGEWIEVEDVYKGGIYKVEEKSGSKNLPSKGSIYARMAKVDGIYSFVGANPILLPITHTERMKSLLRREFKKMKPSAKDTIQLLLNKAANQFEEVRPPMPTTKEVKNKRKELKKKFEKLAFRYNLKLSFEEVAQRIYGEDRTNVLDFFQKLADDSLGQDFLVNEMQFLQDMWNWLPHDCLGGNAPVEMYAKLKRAEKL